MEINNNRIQITNGIRNDDIKNENINGESAQNVQKYNPQFRGLKDEFFNKSGWFMNSIEKGGFLVLFLVQDFLGMTLPRSIAGFLRDKEETGHYNIQEGFEVMGREMLTGPIMMAIAPLSLLIAGKFAKSTSSNTDLIKYYGNNLKEIVSNSNFDRTLLNNSANFEAEFLKQNIEKILTGTLGKDNYTKESVEYILQQLKNIKQIPNDAKLEKFRGKSKYRSKCMDNIIQYINEQKYKTGSNLELLNKVKLGEGKTERVFKTSEAFSSLLKYSDDTIILNKNLNKLNESLAESLKHNALGKRILTNVAIFTSTIAVLSVLPKLYAKSNTAPGARRKSNANNIEKENCNVTFKGKANIPENIGKLVDKNNNKFVSSELEYNGHNFTNTLFALLSVFGMIAGRVKRAYNRAEKDENGKRDLTEIWEILTRDIASSLAVIFAVPMITRAAVSSYEKHSGFVLMNKDRTINNKFKKFLDLLNPYSKSHVYTNSELSSIYDNINSKEKIVNFCKFIDKNGGDIEKIISKSENKNLLLNENILSLNGKDRVAKNKEILNFFENIENNAKKITDIKDINKANIDEYITKIMKGTKNINKNKIFTFARGMNSLPGLVTTLLISPYILGWFIPRLTYKNTRRIHAKQDRQKAQETKTLNA